MLAHEFESNCAQAISSSPLLVDLTAGPADASFTAAVSSACPSNTPNSLLSLSTCVQITTQVRHCFCKRSPSCSCNLRLSFSGFVKRPVGSQLAD